MIQKQDVWTDEIGKGSLSSLLWLKITYKTYRPGPFWVLVSSSVRSRIELKQCFPNFTISVPLPTCFCHPCKSLEPYLFKNFVYINPS